LGTRLTPPPRPGCSAHTRPTLPANGREGEGYAALLFRASTVNNASISSSGRAGL
jgi:hypothetical protein